MQELEARAAGFDSNQGTTRSQAWTDYIVDYHATILTQGVALQGQPYMRRNVQQVHDSHDLIVDSMQSDGLTQRHAHIMCHGLQGVRGKAGRESDDGRKHPFGTQQNRSTQYERTSPKVHARECALNRLTQPPEAPEGKDSLDTVLHPPRLSESLLRAKPATMGA